MQELKETLVIYANLKLKNYDRATFRNFNSVSNTNEIIQILDYYKKIQILYQIIIN